jgi:hypothetical protein
MLLALVKNIPESNGKVGIIGISYDGFLPLMALVNPHPALKVAVPMNPMVDGWMGDDWFHNGAFRQINLSYMLEQVVTRGNEAKWFTSHYDDYDMYMRAGSAGELARQRGLEQSGFWRKMVRIRAYDAFWQQQAMDKILARSRSRCRPCWCTACGTPRTSTARSPCTRRSSRTTRTTRCFCRWVRGTTAARSATAAAGRAQVRQRHRAALAPGDAAALPGPLPEGRCAGGPIPTVTAFETGTNKWRNLEQWPSGCSSGCAIAPARSSRPTPLRLAQWPEGGAGRRRRCQSLRRIRVRSGQAGAVPPRPIPPYGYDEAKGQTWPRWLVDDQREASGRTDVLTFVSDVLTAPVKISGEPVAQPAGVDQRHRCRLGGQADRRVSGPGGGQPEHGRLPADGVGRHLPRPLPRELRDGRSRWPPTRRCPTASRCRPPTTCSCRATASWCRCSRAGSRCTTAIRRPSCRTSSWPSRRTTRRRRSGFITSSYIELPLVVRLCGGVAPSAARPGCPAPACRWWPARGRPPPPGSRVSRRPDRRCCGC